MGATERVKEFIDFKGITKYQFCKDLGFSNKFLDNSSNMGTDKASKILHYFPDLNSVWLLTGEGEMITTKSLKNVVKKNDHINDHIYDHKPNVYKKVDNENAMLVSESQAEYGIPLIPIDAMAGFGSGSERVMDYETSKYLVPEFTEMHVDFMIRVKGSSMYPSYNSGDVVACKKLSINDIFFQWNKVYVLDTEQGAIVKRINKGSDADHVELHSDNHSYDPFPLHLSKIYAIALVVGVIRFE